MWSWRESREILVTRKSSVSEFRPDIEGLRAVAVVLVVLAHFSVPGFSAGFIGVDIFFVISGYLITGIIIREYEASDGIRLMRFYANRLRRLLPALFAMLLISSVAASFIFSDAKNLVHSLTAATAMLWVSNIYFTYSDVNYFSGLHNENALLHTWSLGVEEQFYIVWPICILVVMRFFRVGGEQKRLRFFFLLVFILLLSLCIFLSKEFSIFSYYMMPTRAWQFAAGALVWILCRSNKWNDSIVSMVGWIGASLLLIGIFSISSDTAYPGFWALIPTVSTCALLVSGQDSVFERCDARVYSVSSILSKDIMRNLGGISYSWYLWHWPVVVLGEVIVPIRGNFLNTVLAILFSLILAFLTKKCVEDPVRFGGFSRIRYGWQMIIGVAFIFFATSQFLRWNTAIHEVAKENESSVYSRAKMDLPIFYEMGCDDWFNSADLMPCIFGEVNSKKTAVLLGDSIGAQWYPALTGMLNPKYWKIIVITKSSCPMVDEPYFYQRIGREYTECTVWRKKAVEWLENRHVDMLFVGGTASSEFTDKQWLEGSERFLEKLSKTADMIYLIESNLPLGFNGPDCLLSSASEDAGSCKNLSENSKYKKVSSLLKNLVAGKENIRWIETSSFVCPENECSAMQDGVVVYRDSQHLTSNFAAMASKHFLQQMEFPLE